MKILSLAILVGCGHIRAEIGAARCGVIVDRIVFLSHLRASNSNIMSLNLGAGADRDAELARWTEAEAGLKSRELRARRRAGSMGCLGQKPSIKIHIPVD